MTIDTERIRQVIRPRPPVSHKGTFGRVLLIGGLYPYGGAILMAASACVNSGAGLVMVATERENIPALHARLPEAMAFDVEDRSLLIQQIRQAEVVLIGPGLGERAVAKEIFQEVYLALTPNQVFILDGSALTILSQWSEPFCTTAQLILTPHQKEWERLSGIPIINQSSQTTPAALKRFPQETILVAKSHRTSIYGPNGQMEQLSVGGPYQATGGMGDTLAGIIAGFVAQFRHNLFETVVIATHIHSAIADQLAQEAYVVLPTRICQELPKVMKTVSEAGGSL